MKTHSIVKHSKLPAFLIVTICLLFPFKASAYLDPGTGSLILQALLGALLTGMVFFKSIVAKVKSFFKKETEE